MSHKERATRVIAWTLAEVAGQKTPGVSAWGQAQILADKFEAAGHLSEPKPREEPSYMLVARSNVRGSALTSPRIVEMLLERIDRLEQPERPRHNYAERSFIDADGDRYMVEQSEGGDNTVLTYESAEEAGMSMFIFKTEDADRIIGLVETAKGWTKK